jgi:16S rRNA processing protein RimM
MVVMGKVVGAQGILGWVKVQTFTEYLDSLLDYDTWYVGNEQAWRPLEVLEANVHGGKVVIAKLQGITDRTAAEKCKGLLIAVPRSELPEQEEGEYYWSDLIGLSVENLEGVQFGTVDSPGDRCQRRAGGQGRWRREIDPVYRQRHQAGKPE